MRYYLIAGEASGDLHASHLMAALKKEDKEADFRFFGGDLMAAQGGTLVKHYSELAYMGFVPVLTHLPQILGGMKQCKRDIMEWRPDAVILVDYPGFNIDIAKYAHSNGLRTFYYISPKIWAWKEWRIKRIKRDVDELFSILPFETDFFEKKHNYPIHYVGNPTADEVRLFRAQYKETEEEFKRRNNLDNRPIIALLAGSRRQEIKDNLPAMIEATAAMTDCQRVVAGAPAIDDEYYNRFIGKTDVRKVTNETYALLTHSTAALVTSGTATLETALFGVPQVVCYKTPLPHIIAFLRRKILSVKYISLVNLIADREVVPELVADTFTIDNIRRHLLSLMPGQPERQAMTDGYKEVSRRLGDTSAPENAARLMHRMLAEPQKDR